MDNEIKIWLYDIQNAVIEIDSFLEAKPKTLSEYQTDLKTKRAIERNLEIIGEALSRILKHEPEISISNSRKIVDTRNRIIHGYDAISDDIVWSIVINHLPRLNQEVTALLGKQ